MICILLTLLVLGGCKDKKPTAGRVLTYDTLNVTDTVADSTVYGTCGEATAMHTLHLITDAGDSIFYMMKLEEDCDVQGGLLVGDRMAVIGKETAEGKVATKVINLTTLCGHWISLDKNFEIIEGGTVQSNLSAENNPWTKWKILNGQLLLNADTFDIQMLGADSLYLENDKGIFVYQRKNEG